MDFFLNGKIKTSQKMNRISKKKIQCLLETKVEENAKTAAFHQKFVGGDKVTKISQNQIFL